MTVAPTDAPIRALKSTAAMKPFWESRSPPFLGAGVGALSLLLQCAMGAGDFAARRHHALFER